MEKHAYITSTGSFLPGKPVTNDEMEHFLGFVHDKPSRLRRRILSSNGIQSRHYALDQQQNTTYQNCELAAQAGQICLDQSAVDRQDIDLVAVGSTQGDLPLPGMASMVQAQLDIPACEIISTHGVCSSGMMALKSAVNQVRLGEKEAALVCASELCSRLLKKSRYEATTGNSVGLEAEFLRWMLSDGAGAMLVQPMAAARGISLRVEWIELISYAADFDLCMSCGTTSPNEWTAVQSTHQTGIDSTMAALGQPPSRTATTATATRTATTKESPAQHWRSWQDYPTYAQAEQDGALLIRQNLSILDNIVKVGVEGFIKLIKSGKVTVQEIDYFVCHYSSHHFKGKIADLLTRSGCMVPEEKWFTNLYTKGNTGCASIFIALDELFRSGRLEPGQVLFCTIPESGRFTTAYMKLTVVKR